MKMKNVFRTVSDTLDLLDRHNIGLIAAGIGFFAVLSIFPALTLVVLAWSLFADPELIGQLVDVSGDVVPEPVHRILTDQLLALIRAGDGQTLGIATLITALATFWSARAGVAALIRGLNAVYRLPHRQTTLRRLLSAFGLTLALCGAMLLAVATVVVAPLLLAFFPLGPTEAFWAEMLRLVLALVAASGALGLVYRYGPNRRGNRPAFLSAGAIVATALWLCMSWAFAYYLANFASYNQVYGSLGAAVALLMWFYLSAYIILLGGTLNAAMERMRSTDRASDPDSAADQHL